MVFVVEKAWETVREMPLDNTGAVLHYAKEIDKEGLDKERIKYYSADNVLLRFGLETRVDIKLLRITT